VFTVSGAKLQRVPADGSALPVDVAGAGSSPELSHDGKWLVFALRGDLFGVRTDGDTARKTLVADPITQSMPTLSPDGRWLSYASDESGVFQVYVRPFPDTKVAKRQVSIGSGYAPRWSRSGRELFYIDGNSDLWAVDVAGGTAFSAGTPHRLFSAESFGPLGIYQFDVSPDGRRFLFSRARSLSGLNARVDELVVVENFISELKAKVPR
jgi:Tol biopolymer transport system component